MKTIPHPETVLGEMSMTVGPVSRERVHARTRQLAWLAGRIPPEVSQTDYEQAKREITGETEPDRQNAALDAPSVMAQSRISPTCRR